MSNILRRALVAVAVACATVTAARADVVVYDGFASVTGNVSAPNSVSPSFGDTLHLAQGGQLTLLGLTLFNGDPGSGLITSGTTVVSIYNNTTPYAGGTITNPLLGTGEVQWSSSNLPVGGLAPGVAWAAFFDFSALDIVLTTDILIVQTFQGLGTSTANGVLIGPNPSIGSSPNTIFESTSQTTAGLISLGGSSTGQVAYKISVVPEPGTALLVLGGLAALAVRRRCA